MSVAYREAKKWKLSILGILVLLIGVITYLNQDLVIFTIGFNNKVTAAYFMWAIYVILGLVFLLYWAFDDSFNSDAQFFSFISAIIIGIVTLFFALDLFSGASDAPDPATKIKGNWILFLEGDIGRGFALIFYLIPIFVVLIGVFALLNRITGNFQKTSRR